MTNNVLILLFSHRVRQMCLCNMFEMVSKCIVRLMLSTFFQFTVFYMKLIVFRLKTDLSCLMYLKQSLTCR